MTLPTGAKPKHDHVRMSPLREVAWRVSVVARRCGLLRVVFYVYKPNGLCDFGRRQLCVFLFFSSMLYTVCCTFAC